MEINKIDIKSELTYEFNFSIFKFQDSIECLT